MYWKTERRQAIEPGDGDVGRVFIPFDLARALLGYLEEGGYRERGGVVLGSRDGQHTLISCAVFPPQQIADGLACSFDAGCLAVLADARASLPADVAGYVGTVVGWVHSHPRLGLFLSRTDVATLSSWTDLDRRAVAVVADPFLSGTVSHRIAWWDRRLTATGRFVTLTEAADDATLPQATALAGAISDHAAPGGRWDVVTARSVIKVIASPVTQEPPWPPARNPAPLPEAPETSSSAG